MRFRVVAAVLLAVSLSSCGLIGDDKRPRGCPRVFLLGEATNIVQFRDGPGRDITDVELEGQIVNFAGECENDEGVSNVKLAVDIALRRGPANTQGRAQFSYFVAIPKFHPAPEGKKVFPVDFSFAEGQGRVTYHDEVTLRIPFKAGEAVPSYEVYLGFQLTPEQLQYNEKRRVR